MQDVAGIPVVLDETLGPEEILLVSGEEPVLPPRFEHEEKTVWLFDKPYFWVRQDGRYQIRKGYSPRDRMEREAAVALRRGEPGNYRVRASALDGAFTEQEVSRA